METSDLIKLKTFHIRSGLVSKIPEPDIERWNAISDVHNKIIMEVTDKMTKKAIETVMQKEYEKGIRYYNQLWDTFNYLYRNGLVTEKEMDIIKAYNHKLSKTKAASLYGKTAK